MIDAAKAKSIAQDLLAKSKKTDLVLLEDRTIEREFGWVFFYENRKYLQTHDLRDKLVGNSPFIVARADGSLHVTGTAHPIETYISAFEKTGRLPERPTKWRQLPFRTRDDK